MAVSVGHEPAHTRHLPRLHSFALDSGLTVSTVVTITLSSRKLRHREIKELAWVPEPLSGEDKVWAQTGDLQSLGSHAATVMVLTPSAPESHPGGWKPAG